MSAQPLATWLDRIVDSIRAASALPRTLAEITALWCTVMRSIPFIGFTMDTIGPVLVHSRRGITPVTGAAGADFGAAAAWASGIGTCGGPSRSSGDIGLNTWVFFWHAANSSPAPRAI